VIFSLCNEKSFQGQFLIDFSKRQISGFLAVSLFSTVFHSSMRISFQCEQNQFTVGHAKMAMQRKIIHMAIMP